jgi:hypothetical protein
MTTMKIAMLCERRSSLNVAQVEATTNPKPLTMPTMAPLNMSEPLTVERNVRPHFV